MKVLRAAVAKMEKASVAFEKASEARRKALEKLKHAEKEWRKLAFSGNGLELFSADSILLRK